MGHALVTAGTSGLGRKVIEKFLEAGHRVTATYYSNAEKAQDVQKELASYRHLLHIEQANVTDKQDLTDLVTRAADYHGGIDYLINNVGPFVFERKKLLDYTTMSGMTQSAATLMLYFIYRNWWYHICASSGLAESSIMVFKEPTVLLAGLTALHLRQLKADWFH